MTKKPTALEKRNASQDGRQWSPSAARNRMPIAEALIPLLPNNAQVLEIASGTGEHAIHILEQRIDVIWQPSDMSESARHSVAAWRESAGVKGLLSPIELDAAKNVWPIDQGSNLDAIVCINMLHIAPWAAGLGVLRGAGRHLKRGGVLFFYGPFSRNGQHVSPSNESFDAQLKEQDSAWGIRDAEEIALAAPDHGLEFKSIIDMPNNNFSLVLEKT